MTDVHSRGRWAAAARPNVSPSPKAQFQQFQSPPVTALTEVPVILVKVDINGMVIFSQTDMEIYNGKQNK